MRERDLPPTARPAADSASVPFHIIREPGDLCSRQVCIFVSYAPDGAIKPYVRLHLAALRRWGFALLFILNMDGTPDLRISGDADALDGLVVRHNTGFDFGAWADAFRVFPTLWKARSVALVNDSIFGPVIDADALIRRALADPSDLVGMTENPEITPHFQSYFLLLKNGALAHPGARTLWTGMGNPRTKREAIRGYEVPLVATYRQLGLTCRALFPWQGPPGGPRQNPTHYRWRELLRDGFPYIKVELLRDNPARIVIDGWREEIADGEQRAAIEAWLALANAGRPPGYAEARGRPATTPSTGFPQAFHSAMHRLLHKAMHRLFTGGQR